MELYTKDYIMLLVATSSILLSTMLVNSAFYGTIFKDDNEASDFDSTDVSPKARWQLMMRYISLFVLFTIVFFFVIILVIYMHYKNKPMGGNPMDKVKSLMTKDFIKWFFMGVLGTMMIFLFYTLVNGDFLVNLKLAPQTSALEDVPQPKMFLWLYAVITTIVMIFGLTFKIVVDQAKKLQKIIYFGLYLMFLAVLVTSFYYFMKFNIAFGFLFIVIYIAILYILYKQEKTWNFGRL